MTVETLNKNLSTQILYLEQMQQEYKTNLQVCVAVRLCVCLCFYQYPDSVGKFVHISLVESLKDILG